MTAVHDCDALRLIAVSDAHPNLVFGAMFNQRTDPSYQRLCSLVRSGELGTVRRAPGAVDRPSRFLYIGEPLSPAMSIPATPDILAQLHRLQSVSEFAEERFYPGAPTEQIRVECEQRVNGFLSDAWRKASSARRSSRAPKALSETFAGEDTEEREKVWDYIGETMRIIGLNDWAQHI